MALIFGRRIEVEVAGLRISEPKIEIEIEREPDAQPPAGEVAIWNLSAENENRIYERGGPVRVSAGYAGNVGVIFEGTVDRVRRERGYASAREGAGTEDRERNAVERERTDVARITRIELASELHSAVRLAGISVRTYRGEVPVRQIMADLIGDLGMFSGPMDAIPAGLTTENWGWASRTDTAIASLASFAGVSYYEDDGTIRFNAPGMAQADVAAFTLSPRNGLIGAPAVTDYGAECASFLNPNARMGAVVRLESETLSGTWKVAGLRHWGTNWVGDFRTEYELRSL